MAATYEIRLNDDRGNRLAVLGSKAWTSFQTTRVVNGIGTCELVLPGGALDPSWYRRDYFFSILRSLDGGPLTLFNNQAYLIQTIDFTDGPDGPTDILHCVDWNDLLRRRIIAYFAGSAQTEKTAAADNMIKAIVRENLGPTASDYAGSTARRLLATELIIDADTSQGASLSKSFAWRGPMIDTLRDIADASRKLGTYLAFDIIATPGAAPRFSTFTGQRGVDRRGEMIPLSRESGTLNNVKLRIDYSDEKNAIYAGGRGEEEDRIIQTAVDTARAGASMAGRTEDFVYSQGDTDATVLADANAQLISRRPRLVFSADFTDSPAVQYGRDIGFGDQVQATARGMTFDCRIDTVQLGVSSDGKETVGIGLRSEVYL